MESSGGTPKMRYWISRGRIMAKGETEWSHMEWQEGDREGL